MSTKSSRKALRPTFAPDTRAGEFIAGFDEVGRAPLAGPVVAACVYVPDEMRRRHIWARVNDSKTLSAGLREQYALKIKQSSCYGIGLANVDEIDRLNIVKASHLAMQRAYESMAAEFDFVPTLALIDGNLLPAGFPCPCEPLIKGDRHSRSIAAASIIAKVYRDALMAELAQEFPHYSWGSNAGYGTPAHMQAIRDHGITVHHRKSFAPCAQGDLLDSLVGT